MEGMTEGKEENHEGNSEADLGEKKDVRGHYKRVNPFTYCSEAGQSGIQLNDPVCLKCLPQWSIALTLTSFGGKESIWWSFQR